MPIWESGKNLRDGRALLDEAKEEAQKSAPPAFIATLIPPIPTPTLYTLLVSIPLPIPTPIPVPIPIHRPWRRHAEAGVTAGGLTEEVWDALQMKVAPQDQHLMRDLINEAL